VRTRLAELTIHSAVEVRRLVVGVVVRSIHHLRWEVCFEDLADHQVPLDCFGILVLLVPPDFQPVDQSSADSLEGGRNGIGNLDCKTYFPSSEVKRFSRLLPNKNAEYKFGYSSGEKGGEKQKALRGGAAQARRHGQRCYIKGSSKLTKTPADQFYCYETHTHTPNKRSPNASTSHM
jgi:hypothetical protein